MHPNLATNLLSMNQTEGPTVWRNFSLPFNLELESDTPSTKPKNVLVERSSISRLSKGSSGANDTLYRSLLVPIGEDQFPNKLSELKHLFENNLQLKKSKKCLNSTTTDVVQYKTERVKQRVLVISKIPSTVGINGILSQICGGPLERIVFHKRSISSTIEVFFIFPEHAKRFYTYCQTTGLFVVHGARPRVEWADEYNTESFNMLHMSVSKHLLNEVLHFGARRTLIFAKIVPGKVLRNDQKLFYPDPQSHFTKDLDISRIYEDFLQYGEIIDLGPVVSRKICFSIHYTDIRSAIIAKRECETPSTEIYKKYGDWSVWYGKDCTDKWCPIL